MTKENNLIIYNNFNSAIQNLSDENAGKLFKILMHYNISGEVIESNELVNFAFLNMKSLIDESKEKYKQKCEKNRQNRLNSLNKNNDNERQETLTNDNERQEMPSDDEKINQYNKIKYNKIKENKINNNKNINKEEQKEIKAIEKLQQYKNPDLMFDNKINQVFELYKKKCPNLCPLVFEERNIERRQQVKDLLILCRYDLGYIEGLFNRANEQITFFDEKINFQSLIKNHEKIYQGIGAKKPEKKETAETMQEKFAKWEAEAKEREARENNDINW